MKQGTSKHLIYLLKVIFVLGVFYWVLSHVLLNTGTPDIAFYLKETLTQTTNLLLMIIVLLLMPLNWLVESYKWKLLLKPIFPVSQMHAFKSVFSGTTTSILTPNRIGEFAGRILVLPEGTRINAGFSTLIGGYSQLTTTLALGFIGTAIYLFNTSPLSVGLMSIFGCAVAIFLTIFIYFRSVRFTHFISTIRILERLKNYFLFLSEYQQITLEKLLLYSAMRFMIFGTQFYLTLMVFGVNLSFIDGVSLIPIIYLIMAIIPTIALAELGIRESVAITVLSVVSSNELGILLATFCLWTVNLAIPAMIGGIFLIQAKKN